MVLLAIPCTLAPSMAACAADLQARSSALVQQRRAASASCFSSSIERESWRQLASPAEMGRDGPLAVAGLACVFCRNLGWGTVRWSGTKTKHGLGAE